MQKSARVNWVAPNWNHIIEWISRYAKARDSEVQREEVKLERQGQELLRDNYDPPCPDSCSWAETCRLWGFCPWSGSCYFREEANDRCPSGQAQRDPTYSAIQQHDHWRAEVKPCRGPEVLFPSHSQQQKQCSSSSSCASWLLSTVLELLGRWLADSVAILEVQRSQKCFKFSLSIGSICWRRRGASTSNIERLEAARPPHLSAKCECFQRWSNRPEQGLQGGILFSGESSTLGLQAAGFRIGASPVLSGAAGKDASHRLLH